MVTYPNGREVSYDYGTAGAIDEVMSRVGSIFEDADDDGQIDSGEEVFAAYKYLGRETIVVEDYVEAEVKLDYLQDGTFGGLDRFGRVVDQVWIDYGAEPDAVLDEHTYVYDRAGNRTSRDNELHADFDEDYTYDDLDRLESTERADDVDQSWTLDGLGNWSVFDDDGDTQTRTSNAANEITEIDSSDDDVDYDTAGNMIRAPKLVGTDDYIRLTYDAWNRLVLVQNIQDPLSEIEYDGLGRRIVKTAWADGNPLGTTYYDYNTEWQCLEERLDPGNEQPWVVACQYVWSERYIDAMILRDRDTDSDGDLDERLYALSDANYNVTAAIDENGTVAERYLYDAYGNVTILDPGFTLDADNASDYAWQYLYTGRQLDTESGLMYYRNRYYHPGLGRFVSRDPVGYAFGDMSLYRYVSCNPARWLDPLGFVEGLQKLPKPVPIPDPGKTDWDDFNSVLLPPEGSGGGDAGVLWWLLLSPGQRKLDCKERPISECKGASHITGPRKEDGTYPTAPCSDACLDECWRCEVSFPKATMSATFTLWRLSGVELDENLLNHEVLHIKIANAFAAAATSMLRAVKKSSYSCSKNSAMNFANDAAMKELRAVSTLMKQKHEDFQKDYDKQTNHSENAQAQDEWEKNWEKKMRDFLNKKGK